MCAGTFAMIAWSYKSFASLIGSVKMRVVMGKQFYGAFNRRPLKEKLLCLWGSSSHEFWSICSVISRNDGALFHCEKNTMKSPILTKSYDFVSTTAQNNFQDLEAMIFCLIFCLCSSFAYLYWSRFLLSAMPLITHAVIDWHWTPWADMASC